MEVKIKFNEINVKDETEKSLVKVLMLKGEKGDPGASGNYNDLTNKPTKLSDFTNDGVFITNAAQDLANYYKKSETYTQTEINNLIAAIPKFDIEVVQQLPSTDISTTTVYLVPSVSETNDIYKEFIYVNNAWELLGIQKADLTNYYNKTETDTLLNAKANTNALAAVATSGSYNDLSNKPTIPAIQTGTWNPYPSVGSGTSPAYTTYYAKGEYYRIGDMVYILLTARWYIDNLSGQNNTGVCISGLPFTAANIRSTAAHVLAGRSTGVTDSFPNNYIFVGNNTATIYLNNSNNDRCLYQADTDFYIDCSGWYQIAAGQ